MLETWGTEVLNQIDEVSMDMSGNYKGLVSNLLPNADITVDRFHVMKLVNEELDLARRNIRKAAESLSEPTAKAKLKATLHQSKYVLLKPEDDWEHVTFAMSTNAQRVRMIARESENSEDNSVEYHEST